MSFQIHVTQLTKPVRIVMDGTATLTITPIPHAMDVKHERTPSGKEFYMVCTSPEHHERRKEDIDLDNFIIKS